MENNIGNVPKKEPVDAPERITFKTGSSSYSFSQAWVENSALKDILVGLIVDDYRK
jgi:hypothetical protein